MVITNRIPAGDKGRARGAGLPSTNSKKKKRDYHHEKSKKTKSPRPDGGKWGAARPCWVDKCARCVKEWAGFVVGKGLCCHTVAIVLPSVLP